jgi:Protein of unknown function (DUF3617)
MIQKIMTSAVIAITVGCMAHAHAAGTVQIEPGQWSMPNQIWLNGKEISLAFKGAKEKMLQQARQKMTKEQRAEFDQKVAGNSGDTQCITPEKAQNINPEQMLKTMFKAPWQCQIDPIEANGAESSSQYHCTTPAGGQSEGKATWQVSPRQFHVELNGKGNVVNNNDGVPLDKRLVAMRSVTEGKWLSAQCTTTPGVASE